MTDRVGVQAIATDVNPTVANADGTVLSTDRRGNLLVSARCASVTDAAIAADVASVELAAANPARRGWAVFNDSAATLYLRLGAAATLTEYTVKVPAGAYYEMPFGFTGAVHGTWSAATGTAHTTEFS